MSDKVTKPDKPQLDLARLDGRAERRLVRALARVFHEIEVDRERLAHLRRLR